MTGQHAGRCHGLRPAIPVTGVLHQEHLGQDGEGAVLRRGTLFFDGRVDAAGVHAQCLAHVEGLVERRRASRY